MAFVINTRSFQIESISVQPCRQKYNGFLYQHQSFLDRTISVQPCRQKYNVFLYQHQCTVILTFYTAANVHSITKQLLRIIHTSLAHRKSFHEKPSERYHPAKELMLGQTGTNELQMGR